MWSSMLSGFTKEDVRGTTASGWEFVLCSGVNGSSNELCQEWISGEDFRRGELGMQVSAQELL